MKNIRNLLLSICLFQTGYSSVTIACEVIRPESQAMRGSEYLRSAGCGPFGDIPILPHSLPGLYPIPKEMIPFEPKLPLIQPVFQFVNTQTTSTVSFRSSDPNPPSCKIIAGRLKNHTAHISEMSYLTDKMNHDQKLTFQEVRDYIEMTRKYVPEVLDDIDQTVELDIEWRFFNFKPADQKGIFYFLQNSPNDFHNFIVQGPGLKWTSTGEDLPPFFKITVDENVSISYQMQMLDFCFGGHTLTIEGRFLTDFGPQDPILKASWEPDILKTNQFDFWTIKNVKQLADEEAKSHQP